jgi:hypothetical protein
MALLDAHLKAATAAQKMQHVRAQHQITSRKPPSARRQPRAAANPERYKWIVRQESPMTDESKLEQAVAKAARAQDLLDNELLSEAFEGLEDGYTAAWRATLIEDVAAREKLFLAINILGKVRDHLSAIVANGKLAQVELKELAETAERRKRFGIV